MQTTNTTIKAKRKEREKLVALEVLRKQNAKREMQDFRSELLNFPKRRKLLKQVGTWEVKNHTHKGAI